MKLYLVKTPSGHLVPATKDDRTLIASFRAGDMLPVELKGKPRNGDHHRKFMALVGFVADHHPIYNDTKRVLIKLKLETGHYRHWVLETGKLIYDPLSISFEDMSEAEFCAWSAKAKAVIFEKLLPQFSAKDRQNLAREIDQWIAWT